jgi:hypothetical protein
VPAEGFALTLFIFVDDVERNGTDRRVGLGFARRAVELGAAFDQ